MLKHLTATAALLTAPFAVFANDMTPTYTYSQVGYVQSDIADLDDFTLKGFELKSSYAFSDNFFIEGTYSDVNDDATGIRLDAQRLVATLGYIQHINARTTIDYQLGYGDVDLGVSNEAENWEGGTHYYIVESNLRHKVTTHLEFYGGLEWQNWDDGDNQKAYKLGVKYNWDKFAIGTEYNKYSDEDTVLAYLRYEY